MCDRRTSILILSAMATLAGVAGCAPEMPIEPAILAQRAALLAKNTGQQTAQGTGFAGAHDSTLRKVSAAVALAKEDLGPALPSPLPSPLLDVLTKNSFIATLFDAKSPLTLEQKLNDVSVQLERWVKERLLAPANLESKTDTEATYLLKAEPTCRPLAAPGVTPPPADPACKAQLEKIQARVLMKALLEGIDLRFVVGPDKLEVSNIVLRLDGLQWTADLSKSALATEYVNATLGETDDSGRKFTKLAGKTVVNVNKDATTGVSITASVTEPLEIRKADKNGKPVSSLKLAASKTPVLAVTGDGATKTMIVQLALGAMELGAPWDPAGAGVANVDHGIGWKSVSAEARLDEGARELRLSNVAIAGYEESVRGTRTLAVAFNPTQGGKFDALVKLDAAGLPSFEVASRFEMTSEFKMAALAPDFGAAAKRYLPEETFRLVLDGAAKPARVQLLTQGGQFAGVEVQAGTFTIDSTKAREGVAVAKGKCLTRSKAALAAGAHPLLGLLATVDCPQKTTSGGNSK